MRIYLCGASGTGKTSVGEILADHFGIDHMPSVSRNSPFEQGSFEHQEFCRKGIVQSANEEGVHDRTLLDVLAYNMMFGVDSRQLLLDIASWAYTEPVVIYFPIYFEAENDGVRPTDQGFNERIDEWIRAGLGLIQNSCGYHTMQNESVEARAEGVIRELEKIYGKTA